MVVNISDEVSQKGLFPISGGIWTNCVWKGSYKLWDNHLDLDLDAPSPPRSNYQSFV